MLHAAAPAHTARPAAAASDVLRGAMEGRHCGRAMEGRHFGCAMEGRHCGRSVGPHGKYPYRVFISSTKPFHRSAKSSDICDTRSSRPTATMASRNARHRVNTVSS